MITTINKLKKGDFFKLVDKTKTVHGKTVYYYEGYNRQNKKYQGSNFGNNQDRYFKKSQNVLIGFTF